MSLRSFNCDERGGIYVMTALILPLLIGFGGLAVDFARASNARATLQASLDAAVLAAAAEPSENLSQAKFNEILVAKGLEPGTAMFERSIDDDGIEVSAMIASRQATGLASALGVNFVSINANSKARSPLQISRGEIEVRDSSAGSTRMCDSKSSVPTGRSRHWPPSLIE